MKTLSVASLISVSFLTGCASNPSVDSGASAEEYAKNIYGQEYNFITKSSVLIPSIDGSHDEEYGLYGLRLAFKPFAEHCKKDGGEFHASDKNYFSGYSLPTQLNCMKKEELLWAIEQNYSNTYKYFAKTTSTPWYFATLKPRYYTGKAYADIQNKLIKENAQLKENKRISLLMMKDAFIENTKVKKNIGDQICTENNSFGYVEAISKDNVKVSIIGKVENKPYYFFFRKEAYLFSNNQEFTYKKVTEPLIWTKSNKWSQCTFDVNI